MSEERGVIKFKARAKQLNSFRDLLRHRNITPTDIDGLIDYNGKAFIYLEGKMKNKTLDIGQKKALESVVRSHWRAQNPSIVIYFWHDTPSDCEVQVAWMFVKMIFTIKPITCLTGKQHQTEINWYHPQTQTTTVKQAIEYFEEQFKHIGL